MSDDGEPIQDELSHDSLARWSERQWKKAARRTLDADQFRTPGAFSEALQSAYEEARGLPASPPPREPPDSWYKAAAEVAGDRIRFGQDLGYAVDGIVEALWRLASAPPPPQEPDQP